MLARTSDMLVLGDLFLVFFLREQFPDVGPFGSLTSRALPALRQLAEDLTNAGLASSLVEFRFFFITTFHSIRYTFEDAAPKCCGAILG